MLLWVLVLPCSRRRWRLSSRTMPQDLHAAVLAVQSWISGGFLLFILLTSDPFARMANPPIEGQDLNPLLQDPGLAIHPPLLYLGYVGLSITFAFAAARFDLRPDRCGVRASRAAVDADRLDIPDARHRDGLLLGLLHARLGRLLVLGPGRECLADALARRHGAAPFRAVMEKREALKIWTIFLAILAFSLSLIGTFLVRSGVLTSVHAFANDPQRGVFILAILVFFIGGSLRALRLCARASLKPGGLFAPVSRGGRARSQQSAVDDMLRHGFRRHALSAGA